MHIGNTHRMGYLMLHHVAGATIQVANLVNYNCHPREIPQSRTPPAHGTVRKSHRTFIGTIRTSVRQ